MVSLELLLAIILTIRPSISAHDFLYNSFTRNANAAAPLINLTHDARLAVQVIFLTNYSNQSSLGRAFYPSPIPFKPTNNPNSSNISASFSTQFVFSISREASNGPGFGLAFVLSASSWLPNALAGQYFGLFSRAINTGPAPLLAVEFDTGWNPEFNDPDGNHVGIDLNSIQSIATQTAGYFDSSKSSTSASFVPFNMRNGQNIHAWIDFSGPRNEINVTIAPFGVPRPNRPLLTFRNPVIANYVSAEMYVGFSASKTTGVEAQIVSAWSFSDTGLARDIHPTNLTVIELKNSSSGLSSAAISGTVIGCVLAVAIGLRLLYWFWWRRRNGQDDEVEDWELEYWPHRFSYKELFQATNGFSKEELLGSGGFGKVYKGVLANNTEVAVKYVNHDSKQGPREFMAEISSMGRLQHKNLVPLRGWCRKGNEMMLVYDYMPNGSLNRWIFDNSEKLMGWKGRRRVLADVAEGLNYLHHGWDQVVVHRDIKPSNVLLDSEMRGRLGDFGLAKLYAHGAVPNTTRVVGTFGYLAPEVAKMVAPTAGSDVYSFGVVVLEVACGRKPIDTSVDAEEEEVLIHWVRRKYTEGRLWEAADKRIKGEFEVEEMEAVLKLGLVCCHPDPLRRPTMREVVAVLLGEDVTATPKTMISELTTGVGDNEGGETASLPLLPV